MLQELSDKCHMKATLDCRAIEDVVALRRLLENPGHAYVSDLSFCAGYDRIFDGIDPLSTGCGWQRGMRRQGMLTNRTGSSARLVCGRIDLILG